MLNYLFIGDYSPMTTSMEKIFALISSDIDAMKGTDDVYYKEKLRNGIQDAYQSHKDEFQNDVKFLSQVTEEAIKNAHSVTLNLIILDNQVYFTNTKFYLIFAHNSINRIMEVTLIN